MNTSIYVHVWPMHVNTRSGILYSMTFVFSMEVSEYLLPLYVLPAAAFVLSHI